MSAFSTTLNWSISICVGLSVAGCALPSVPVVDSRTTINNSFGNYERLHSNIKVNNLIKLLATSSSILNANTYRSLSHVEDTLDNYCQLLALDTNTVPDQRPAAIELALFKQFYKQWLIDAHDAQISGFQAPQSYAAAAGELVYRILSNEYRISQK